MIATDAPALIEVERLSYEYPGLRALDGISFRIAQGSITALVGPNGAGKTTLLRCLAGMDQPLAGDIRIAGVDVIMEPRRSHREIGYLSDFFGLYDDLSVRRGLAYVAAANGIARAAIPTLVERTACELGLGERLDQRAGELSRGLRQRVAIAQAVIHGPRVVLLDEPASGLDPEARYQLGALFVALRARGMTLLVSSHILAELEAYSTDLLILRDGRTIDHRPIGATPHPGEQLTVTVLERPERAAALLGTTAGVSALDSDGAELRFRFAGDPAARAALLATLVRAGVAVTHFGVVPDDLQQSYLRSIRRANAADES